MAIPAGLPNPQPQRRTRKRTKILAAVLGLWAFAVCLRLIELQIIRSSYWRARVTDQNRAAIDIPAERGAIFDRNGDILAENVPTLTVYYRPVRTEPFETRLQTVLELRSFLGLGPGDMERITAALREDRPVVTLKRKIDTGREDEIRRLGLKNVFAMRESSRVYPQGLLAAQVLGGVKVDNSGAAGVEYKFDSLLSGTKGSQLALVDGRKREYHFEPLAEPSDGGDIVLTIDKTIQYFAQSALERAALEPCSSWGAAIVCRPATGEILALANWPDYDPNAYSEAAEASRPNRAVQHAFDPGSTFKIVTAAAALESRGASLTDLFDCSAGVIDTAGTPIRDHKAFGILSFPSVFIHSSNVGTIMIGRRVGTGPMYRAIRAFGFGERTGIELPAESAGIVHPPAEWSRRSIDSISIGYEISATPLQVLQAANIVANGGVRVPPRIIKNLPGAAGGGAEAPGSSAPILSTGTVDHLVEILERVVTEGTGESAAVRGYDIAGKTGTTQLLDPATRTFSTEKHLATFVGFVPAREPVLSIIVVLDAPRSDAYYGGQVAAPVFRDIAVRTLRYLGIPPQSSPVRSIIALGSPRGERP
jgi:cell division protein FtsI (penicillin-binding protein 3)